MSGPTPSSPGFSNSVKFKQYKLFVQTVEHNSDRRSSTQRFYTTIHTSLLTLLTIVGGYGLLSSGGAGANQSSTSNPTFIATAQAPIVIAICALGIILCVLWRAHLQAFRLLAAAKFTVINEMEKQLPFQGFKDEWDILKGKVSGTKPVYVDQTTLERMVPLVGIGLYIVLALIYFAFSQHWLPS